jgi:hypothetical protein
MFYHCIKRNLLSTLVVASLVLLLVSSSIPAAAAITLQMPGDFYPRSITFQNVNLSWSYADRTSISGFELYRSVGNAESWELVDSPYPIATGYTDVSLKADTDYYYRLRAWASPWAGTEKDYSEFVTLHMRTSPINPEIPATPTDLKAVIDGDSAILTWNDNSSNETYFEVLRSTDGGSWGGEADVGSNDVTSPATYTVKYTYKGLSAGTVNTFKVRAVRDKFAGYYSAYSNEAVAVVSSSTPTSGAPKAPTNLEAKAYQTAISLTWKDNATNEDCFYLSRQENNNGTWRTFDALNPGTFSYNDWDVKPGTTYSYKVEAANHAGRSLPSNIVTFVAPSAPTEQPKPKSKQLRFFIGSSNYYVDDSTVIMEVAPVIYHDRTMLPIAYIAEPIGAQTTWDATSGKITISLGSNTIELWLGSNTAKVNGATVSIDANDLAVTPLVLPPGRTMVPLGFIAHTLGCSVNWNAATQEVTINYFGQ